MAKYKTKAQVVRRNTVHRIYGVANNLDQGWGTYLLSRVS